MLPRAGVSPPWQCLLAGRDRKETIEGDRKNLRIQLTVITSHVVAQVKMPVAQCVLCLLQHTALWREELWLNSSVQSGPASLKVKGLWHGSSLLCPFLCSSSWELHSRCRGQTHGRGQGFSTLLCFPHCFSCKDPGGVAEARALWVILTLSRHNGCLDTPAPDLCS